MTAFVLVHGAGHGAWCWYKVVPLLEAEGHRVVALDLPGCGVDQTPRTEVSLQANVDRIGEGLDAVGEPAVLVAHSAGGHPITQAAERFPDQIRTLVYLTAVLPQNGQTARDTRSQTELDRSARLVEVADGMLMPRDDHLVELYYHDCDAADVALARSLLVPHPMAPAMTPVTTTAERYGRIPRVYIETIQDRAIVIADQRAMTARTPCERIISMDTSHSPFFSAPGELAQHLMSI